MDESQELHPTVLEHSYDMAKSLPKDHRFDYIRGNQLICSLHDSGCPSITIKPTQVLEPDEQGVLQLVDKAPREQ